MSSLLEQAIVDAKALKEAAIKNAEATIVDKYSEEVKATLDQLLEQDELADLLGASEASEEAMQEEVEEDEIAEGIPDAFTEDSSELGGVSEGESTEVTIDFAELAEALQTLREEVEDEAIEEVDSSEPIEEEIGLATEEDISEEAIMEMVADMLSGDTAAEEEADVGAMSSAGLEEAEEEELYEELSDELLDAIMEKLTVDMGATLSGWAGRRSEDTKYQMELELAHRRSTEVQEELEALKQAQEELVFENKKLQKQLSDYQKIVGTLKENVQDVNLSNARLLYTNRTLRNTSLNERQKNKIVEAISKAGSVEEAKTIHETLQSTVASAPSSRPQTLSEAISRPASIIRASRIEESKVDPLTTRMRKLAGIE
jgi:hypothetical protein